MFSKWHFYDLVNHQFGIPRWAIADWFMDHQSRCRIRRYFHPINMERTQSDTLGIWNGHRSNGSTTCSLRLVMLRLLTRILSISPSTWEPFWEEKPGITEPMFMMHHLFTPQRLWVPSAPHPAWPWEMPIEHRPAGKQVRQLRTVYPSGGIALQLEIVRIKVSCFEDISWKTRWLGYLSGAKHSEYSEQYSWNS